MPFNYMFPLRATQALLAIIEIGLTGSVAAWYSSHEGVGSPSQVNILIWSSIWTLLATIYLSVSPVYFPAFSHKYAVAALEALTMLFWFAGFLALGVFLSMLDVCEGLVCHSARAGAVFGAFEWILFSITTTLAVMHVWRTRHTLSTKPAATQQVRSNGIV